MTLRNGGVCLMPVPAYGFARLRSPLVNQIPDPLYQQIVPGLKKACPRLTELDLREAQQRIDLLTAKIQNRHWVSKIVARRTVLALMQQAGSPVSA